MSDSGGVGWCANVLAAESIAELVDALQGVAAELPPKTPVGLWFPETMCQEDPRPVLDWLRDAGCPLLGFNAFPQYAFHAPVVKDAVYRPDWAMQERLAYTINIAGTLAGMIGRGGGGGVTTVPVGWPDHDVDVSAAADNIRLACEGIAELAKATGTDLHLAIEPEPGCILQTGAALADFVLCHQLDDLA